MWSAMRTLAKRCEIRSTVRPANSSRTRENSSTSERGSSDAVGSSRMIKAGVAQERPRQRDPLPLPAGQIDPAVELWAEHGVVAVRKLGEEVMRPGGLGGSDDRGLVVDQAPVAEADVLPRRQLVVDEVLEEDRDPGTELRGVKSAPCPRRPRGPSPSAGGYRPARILANVVLPDPFSPTSAMTCPSGSSTETSCSAGSVRLG